MKKKIESNQKHSKELLFRRETRFLKKVHDFEEKNKFLRGAKMLSGEGGASTLGEETDIGVGLLSGGGGESIEGS